MKEDQEEPIEDDNTILMNSITLILILFLDTIIMANELLFIPVIGETYLLFFRWFLVGIAFIFFVKTLKTLSGIIRRLFS